MQAKGQTFSEQVKQNLVATYPKKQCCRRALACGMYLTSRAFAQSGTLGDKEHLFEMMRKLRTDVALEEIGALFTGEKPFEDLLCCGECLNAFLKGVFLSCGTVTDPQHAGYHLEFALILQGVCDIVKKALTEAGFSPKQSTRHQNTSALYMKNGEEIGDFLNFIGANKDAFRYINIKIEKGIRNSANRRTNCDTANIDKAVRSATEQLDAIRFLEDCGILSHLPLPLQTTAQLRKENPEMTLAELVKQHPEKVSKSGVNHRLQKIVQLANERKKEGQHG